MDDIESGEPGSLEERARIRRHRELERNLRKRRERALTACAVVLVVAALALLSPWGPLSGVFFSESKDNGSAAADMSEEPVDLQTAPESTALGLRPGAALPYSWVDLRLPEREEKKSVVTPPTVAIVVDDVGNTSEPLAKWTTIDAPISFAVFPYPPLSRDLAWALHQSGYAIMMHIPTQNAPPNSFSGSGQLEKGMDRAAVFSRLDSDVSCIPYVAGINNHQGGLGCDDMALMYSMCEWAKQRSFYVVDSNSSVNSRVTEANLKLGGPKRRNQVFIDHQNDPEYIRGAMRELAGLARENGTAIGICHWHRPNTATVVGEMVRELEKEGINFAFAKDITN